MMAKYEIVERILAYFDFGTVEAYMHGQNWVWKSAGGVPTVDQLKDKARELLANVLEEDLDFAASGGFCADKRCGRLSLAFQIEEYSEELKDFTEDPPRGLCDKNIQEHIEPPKTPPRANKPYSGPSYRITIDPDGAVVVEIAENKQFSSWRRYHLVEI